MDDNLLVDTSDINTFSQPIQNMVFTDEKGQEVGRIDWSGGSVKFTGNVEESARVFFDCLIKQYIFPERKI